MVVAVGETVTEPLTATVPTPWSIEAPEALEVVHESVVDWPEVMVVAVAVKVLMETFAGAEMV